MVRIWPAGEITVGWLPQLLVLVVFMLIMLRRLIVGRLGSLAAVRVISGPRFIMCVVLCALVLFLVLRGLLLLRPFAAWWRLAAFCAGSVIAGFIMSPLVSHIGRLFDGGRAIVVVTGRYKIINDVALGFTDLAADNGRNAQLIPRVTFVVYGLLVMFCMLLGVLANIIS